MKSSFSHTTPIIRPNAGLTKPALSPSMPPSHPAIPATHLPERPQIRPIEPPHLHTQQEAHPSTSPSSSLTSPNAPLREPIRASLRERKSRKQTRGESKPFSFDIKWGKMGDSKRVLTRKFRKLQYKEGRNQFSPTNIKIIKKLVAETNETIKKRKQTFSELPYRDKLTMRKNVEKTTVGLSPDDKRKLKGMIRKGM